MSITELRQAVDQLEKDRGDMINAENLQKILQGKRDNHSNQVLREKKKVNKHYQEGFADGLQEAMNTVVGLLDEKRLN